MKRANRDTFAAARLFRGFREIPPTRARRVSLDIPEAVAVMGTVELIVYTTTHGRKVTVYCHEFAPGSKPLFCAGPRRNQAFLIGGRYKVTDRGIVDYGPRGREVRARSRFKVDRKR